MGLDKGDLWNGINCLCILGGDDGPVALSYDCLVWSITWHTFVIISFVYVASYDGYDSGKGNYTSFMALSMQSMSID